MRIVVTELLSTTVDDLVAFAEPLEKLSDAAGICVIGAQRQIEACQTELNKVFPL